MTSPLDSALQGLGVNLDPAGSLSASIEDFNVQNLSPSDIFEAARNLPQTVGGIPGIGSRVPGLGKIPLPTANLPNILGGINKFALGTSGTWQSPKYAADLNAHHAKFKFLFKVTFSNFGVSDFYCFVHRVDKPKVRFNHQDANYYNFRTRVITSTTYDPLSVTFLDEIGNTVNTFFVEYLKKHSGTGAGAFGIDRGFGEASSTKPYKRGYSDPGASITVEQIFANGTLTNRFVFLNARVETFDFDELSMEDSAGSLMTLTFSYDAIRAYTVPNSVMYRWGNSDLLAGGGTSGPENAGSTGALDGEVFEGGFQPTSALGAGNTGGGSIEPYQPEVVLSQQTQGQQILNQVPPSLSTSPAASTSRVGSSQDVLSSDVQQTLRSIQDGTNLKFGGQAYPRVVEPPLVPDDGLGDSNTLRADPVPIFTSSGG